MSKVPNLNNINRKLLSEILIKIDEAIKLLRPCYESINPEKAIMGSLEGTDQETRDFLILSHEIARKFPEMYSPFLDMESFFKSFSVIEDLWNLSDQAAKFKQYTDEMINAACKQNLETAFLFYNILKTAANRNYPGARLIYDDLKKAFPGKRRLKKPRD